MFTATRRGLTVIRKEAQMEHASLSLGRWKMKKTPKEEALIVNNANTDHCGAELCVTSAQKQKLVNKTKHSGDDDDDYFFPFLL